jgi:predicted amidohydrolase YtcJ
MKASYLALYVLFSVASLHASGCARERTEAPDLLLLGGKVFTAEETRPWAEAVAIRGERILAVGTSEEIDSLGGPDTRRIHLGGRTVIPGINDAHRHFQPKPPPEQMLALSGLEPSWDVTRAAIEKKATEAPEGAPIYGIVGVTVTTDPGIDRARLDEVAPRHPVMLSAFYGHGLIVNSPGLAALAIDEEEADPVGGFFERQPGSRRVNGRIFEYAQWSLMRRASGSIPDGEILEQLRAESAEMLRLGIASIQDMPMIPLGRYLDSVAKAQLPLRVRAIRFPMTGVEGRNLSEDIDVSSRGSVTVAGVKWILEGTPLERGVLLEAPYADRPDWSGRLNFEVEEVAAMLRESVARDEPLLLHAVGDRTLALLFDAMENMKDVDWPARRLRIEHGDGLVGGLVERARILGVIVVQNPTHFALAEFMHPRLGPQRRFFPMKSLLAAGIPVAIGSDGSPNPWLDVMLAVVHPTRPEEALSVEQAVTAYTRGSAYAEFREGDKGTLAAGKLADLAVLSQDVFTVPADAIVATESVLTMIGGRIVHDTGVLN